MLSPCSTSTAGSPRPRWEVADVFRLYGEAYRRAHRLPSAHLEVMHAIAVCRTAYLGGHLEKCDSCGFERPAYNSCRNRHCPKCQALAKARWLAARNAELLPVDYFHVVFTVPHELNPVARCNKKIVFDILFKAAAGTLKDFARDPKHGLGGKLGFTAVLHTWDQVLRDHVHLHCVVPGGALANDRSRWIHARKGFLFPVRPLSEVFRGKFIALLQKAFRTRRLHFPGQTAHLGTAEAFAQLARQLWKKSWIVYSKASFPGPTHVLDYLGRYTHRVAISNHRIRKVKAGAVSFSYRDSADAGKKKTLTLPASEFIRRFLLHVLPKGFMRVRHFGFLAGRSKTCDLARCRELLGLPRDPKEPPEQTTRDLLLELTGAEVDICPRCRQRAMRIVAELPPLYPSYLETPFMPPRILDSS